VFGSTFFVTTDPAATTQFSLIVTPFKMTAFIPIQTSAIFTGAGLESDAATSHPRYVDPA
jgi:hypothetical protein